jgi:hypothetical protein
MMPESPEDCNILYMPRTLWQQYTYIQPVSLRLDWQYIRDACQLYETRTS